MSMKMNIPLIIDTSLAPSPMANVTACLCFLMSSTTRAFCSGVTLQHITDRQADITSRNIFSICGCRQCTRECPFTTKANPDDDSSVVSMGVLLWYSISVLSLKKIYIGFK